MEFSIDLIKKQIEITVKSVFIGKEDFDLTQIVDLFINVLQFKINDAELNLENIDSLILNAFFKLEFDNVSLSDRKSYFSSFAKIEQFLRKIAYLKDSSKYNELKANNSGLISFINELRLNPRRARLDSMDIKKMEGNNLYLDHLARVYQLRNIDSHEIIPELSRKDFGQIIESFLVIYLFVVFKYKDLLSEKIKSITSIKEPSFNNYCDSIIDSFQEKINRFIHLSSKENITLSGSYVLEHKLNSNSKSEENIEREGTVEQLRQNLIPENRMIIWGDAGIGKSTTLEYLAYKDALLYKCQKTNNIPVYVQLGLLTDGNISIENYIYSKIGVEFNLGRNIMESGRINLFLDGLNEVPRDGNNQLITLRQKEIDFIFKQYRKVFTILTNRPQLINQFSEVPVFFIQKMNDIQINEFVKKYSEGYSQIEEKILNAITSDNRLRKIIKSPLMLSRLIEIVKSDGDIPSNEGLIIERFIKSLYKREIIEKKDAKFNDRYIHKLLSFLAEYSIRTKGTNSALSENEVLNNFLKTKKEYSMEIDLIYALEICCHLNILERNENKILFAHQSYQDYFNSEYESIILGL